MRLRYFFATLLFLGIFCYGVILLIMSTVERSTMPVAPRQISMPKVVTEGSEAIVVNTSSNTKVLELQETTQETIHEEIAAMPPAADKPTIPTKPTQWGEATRGIVHHVNVQSPSNTKTLFLTINAFSANHEALIQELIKHNVKATFFVSGLYARRNQETVKQLSANQLFDIENLGNRYRPLSVEGKSAYEIAGTNDMNDALKEVADGAASIAAVTGKKPTLFRSGTGYTDDVAVAVVNAAGTKVIGYQTLTDGGGVIAPEEIKKRILQAENGSILVLSINPERPNILKGLQAALEEISAQKLPLQFEKLIDYESAFEIIR
ncbi:MAG: polysaccharide deacetylase family protein [Prevotellaceae bacterium]|jgi:peptidoglycan/xylan/chitin deacetylase (PgdA/CDA1 family)|nr:polysaccharide deacetylase family protein [Prevotellaceae bacterium]